MNLRAGTPLLNAGYAVFPIVAGADKFTNLLCKWEKYLSPLARRVLPVSPKTFMRAVGVIEIAVGAAMLIPKLRRYAAFAASGWLASISVNLIANGDYDIAARDTWLALGAATLGLMSPPMKTLQPGARQRVEIESAVGTGEVSFRELPRTEIH